MLQKVVPVPVVEQAPTLAGGSAAPLAGTEVLLANPRGFCAGVVRAVAVVEEALSRHGAPVHVFHEIVHNGHVVAELRSRGAIFVDRISDIPVGAVTVFSAHGVSRSVQAQAQARGLRVVDAMCPLVAKGHAQVARYARQGCAVIVIGHAGHEEVEGLLDCADAEMHRVATRAEIDALDMPATRAVAYVTQTTLAVDDTRELIAALRRRWPHIVGPDIDGICYASQNRQQAVRDLAGEVDFLLVVGADNSSNTRRLCEVAEQRGVRARRIEEAGAIDPRWLAGVRRVGVTAGASTPEVLVQGVLARLSALGAIAVREQPGVREPVAFRLPDLQEGAHA